MSVLRPDDMHPRHNTAQSVGYTQRVIVTSREYDVQCSDAHTCVLVSFALFIRVSSVASAETLTSTSCWTWAFEIVDNLLFWPCPEIVKLDLILTVSLTMLGKSFVNDRSFVNRIRLLMLNLDLQIHCSSVRSDLILVYNISTAKSCYALYRSENLLFNIFSDGI